MKFSFRPTEYVNDPFIISQQHRMVAINTALEIDLTGQVNAEVAGGKHIGMVGGHGDFMRGCMRSRGGRGIIALESTGVLRRLSRAGGEWASAQIGAWQGLNRAAPGVFKMMMGKVGAGMSKQQEAALNPIIGYEKAAEVIKRSMKENRTIREIVLEEGLLVTA